MKNAKIIRVFAVMAALLLMFPANLFADIIGTVTCIEGRVDKCAAGGDEYLPVVAGDTVSVGDILRTKSYSKAVIALKDNSALHMGDSSQVELKDLSIAENGVRRTAEINLDRGTLRAVVSKTPDLAPFKINTPNALGTVKGSDIFISYMRSATDVLVSEGTFNVTSGDFAGQAVAVREGMTSVIPYNGPPLKPRDYLPGEKEKFEKNTGTVLSALENIPSDAEFTRAVISEVSGAARIQPRGTEKLHMPARDEVLNTGDRIETGKNGYVKLRFDNGLKIELKPDTQLIITRLTRDPKTGNYQNEFESSYGKIVAQLQHLPPGSTFKVKTPHACCGIRGTIMYLDILPNMTKAFFEGGSGYVDDLVNGTSTIINEGITYSVDSSGNVIERNTTNGDRAGFGSQFGNDGGNVYGYTGDAPGTPEADAPGGGNTQGGPDVNGGDTGDNQPFSDVKPNIQEDNKEIPPPVVIQGTIAGKMGDFDSIGPEEGSSIEGTFVAGTTAAPWSGTGDASIEGEYANPGGANMFYTDVTGNGDDGGNIRGYMVGSGNGDNPDWAGVFSAIYIDPSGVAGNMFGIFPGTHTDGDFGNFSSSAGMFYIPYAYTDVLPSGIDSSLDNTDWFDVSMHVPENQGGVSLDIMGAARALYLSGETWGAWEGVFGGMNYSRPDDVAGWNRYTVDLYDEEGYPLCVFTTIEARDDTQGFLRMDVTSDFMDPFMFGQAYGTIVGTYGQTDSYYYEGIGAGGYGYKPLKFVSDLEGDVLPGIYGSDIISGDNLFTESSYSYDYNGDIYGWFGGTDPLWGNTGHSVVFMGGYNTNFATGDGIYPWVSEICSKNYNDDSGMTYDGGAYAGFAGGYIKEEYAFDGKNGSLAGLFRAIYVSPPDSDEKSSLGYFKGTLTTAKFAPDLDMFEAVGPVELYEMPYNYFVAPEDLYEYIERGFLSGYGGNREDISAYMTGGEAIKLQAADWGIWQSAFQGYYYGDLSAWRIPMTGTADFGEGDTFPFVGVLSGDKWVDNGRVDGKFRGIWIRPGEVMSWGIISGDVVTNNTGKWVDVDGGQTQAFQAEWTGAGVGEWVEADDILEMNGIITEMQDLIDSFKDLATFTDTLAASGEMVRGITSATMDISVYADSQVWAAIFNGTYNPASPPTGTDWGATLSSVNSQVDLSGVEWADNKWSANVSGNVQGTSISGAAAGIYDNSGTFTGVGAGVIQAD